jgi:N-acetylglucosaminyldiphosphoundecaprenol N-acetyl-beta-D-mannosaminyltransferase
MSEVEIIKILGVPVQVLTMDGILARIEEEIAVEGCSVAYAVNAHTMNFTYKLPLYKEMLESAEIVYADGQSILLAARILGKPLPEKLTTTDIWPPTCELAQRKGYSFYLLGGEEGLAERTIEVTLQKYPGLRFAGFHNGFFEMDDEKIIEKINAAQPDILWVGMGEPRQFIWAEKHKGRLKARLLITCGGLFKFVSGEVKRAPERVHRSGFEWLFRSIQEPRLIWRYFTGLPLFGLRVLTQRFFGHRGGRGVK